MMRYAKLGTPKVAIPCITLGTINDPNTHYYGSPDLIHITSHIYELPSMTMNSNAYVVPSMTMNLTK